MTIPHITNTERVIQVAVTVPLSLENLFLQLVYSWYSVEDWMAKEQIEPNDDILNAIWEDSLSNDMPYKTKLM